MGINKPKYASKIGCETNNAKYKINRPKIMPAKVKTVASRISKKDIVPGPFAHYARAANNQVSV